MDIKIRRIKEQDVEQLLAIEQESFTVPWSRDAFLKLLQREYCYYLVALKDEKVLGMAGMTILGNEGDIDKVVVAQNDRGKGVATQLLTRLLTDGNAMGVQDYTLEVRVSNASAIHVYEKMGFVGEGVRPRFYEKPTEDALIMWKRQ